MRELPAQTVLCRYHYDATDRSITWVRNQQPGLLRFYCLNRLTTEIQGETKCGIFQHENQLLAQQHLLDGRIGTTLLASDLQRTVFIALGRSYVYTPYGYRTFQAGLMSLLGFNGEPLDSVTGHYHLGNGHRQFNPGLMRFNSPDKLSPFGNGGINAYAYCGNDPLNKIDPTGKAAGFIKSLLGQSRSGGVVYKIPRQPDSPWNTIEYAQDHIQKTPVPVLSDRPLLDRKIIPANKLIDGKLYGVDTATYNKHLKVDVRRRYRIAKDNNSYLIEKARIIGVRVIEGSEDFNHNLRVRFLNQEISRSPNKSLTLNQFEKLYGTSVEKMMSAVRS
jgi:RHS repeat-associated protein